MPKKPDERIGQAKEMFLSGKKLIEIAKQLEIPDGTVRRWKSTYNWETERSEKNNERSNRKRGAQPGNKNSSGGPVNNKKALRTGEFETLFFNTLKEDEKELISLVQLDKEQLLLQEIQLLTVRERRMLKRIEDIKESAEYVDGAENIRDMTAVKYRTGTEKDKRTDLTEYQGKLGQIQSVEDALTRVQARKQKAIDSLHRYGFDDARLDIELMKVELASLKMDSKDTEQEDDGFMAAMDREAGTVWCDGD